MRGSGGPRLASPQNGTSSGSGGGGYEWSGGGGPQTPGSVSSGHFNDALTVDSWNTTMTAMLQPHKSQKNTFQCPTHLGFVTKDPLDVCPHCERQQQLLLQERRRSVEQQLREMDMPSSSSSSVANDILSDLQSTVKQWKQQPVQQHQQAQKQQQQQQQAAPPTPDGNASTSTPNADNTRHQQNNQNQNQYRSNNNQNQNNQNQYNNGGIHHSYSNGSTNSQQQQQQQMQPQQQQYMGGMQMMAPPPPPMVPSFGNGPPQPFGNGPPLQSGGSPLEALALQIQGMQRMQDWMLYQKEQECQTLRQRLDSATQQINTMAVENALLQEKLHQQEQRMKHELKLIKLAAMQQRNNNNNNNNNNISGNKSSASSHNSGSHSDALVVVATNAPRSSNNSVASGNSQGPPSSMANDSFGIFPSSDAMAQPKTSVVTSALTRQDHDNFFNRFQNPHHAGTSAASNQQPRNNNNNDAFGGHNLQQQQFGLNSQQQSRQDPFNSGNQQQQSRQDPFGMASSINNNNNRQTNEGMSATKSTGSKDGNERDALKLMNSLSLSPESHKDDDDDDDDDDGPEHDPPLHHRRNDSGPVDLDALDEMIAAKKQRDASDPSSPQKSLPTTNPSTDDDFSYQNNTNSTNVPRDISIEPSITSVSTEGTRNTSAVSAKPIPALKPPPEKIVNAAAAAKSLKPQQQQQQQWPEQAPPQKQENSGPPPPILVNVQFPDSSDNMSIGNTVASSTYGEDRQQVNSKVILDPYGDRGTYTGVILRSTGMPHGSGRMIYQEDKRTYDGEWRHGRWHGYGRATFANGDNYHGEYRFDQRHGRGRYEWNDGRVYDGMFREDKRHGRGIFQWPDGAVYEGDFRNGQREGHGTYRFSDGGRYEGSWKDGRYNGFGICNWEDGRCYKGEWMNGMAHGKGIETFADGTIRHDGQWVEDEPVIS